MKLLSLLLFASLLSAQTYLQQVRVDAAPSTLQFENPRSIRAKDGRVAEIKDGALYLQGTLVSPRQGDRSWALRDVKGIAFDNRDRLWFASPQGVGVLDGESWTLYTGAEGLPYNRFTTMRATPDGSVWFGTDRGAIHFDGKTWEYRQGRRWLPSDQVQAIAFTPDGTVWFQTSLGVSGIAARKMTLAEKAQMFEAGIDRYHRRTPYEYVLGVTVKQPGNAGEFTQHDSDNDGLWTSMYGAGECFAYAAAKDPAAKRRAAKAFEALRFLGTVTQGGSHPAPPGFVARSILPTSGPDPNATHYTRQKDEQRRDTRDALWKVLVPRWPTSADGKWFWKTDTSSDELDGHYFFYGLYYDLVADSEEEKKAVREHVRGITDHLLAHNYQLVDYDGKPARWSIFNPENLNDNPNFWEERGINSLSILAYLKVAEHMTGDAKYEAAAQKLIRQYGYAANVLIPKSNMGIGAGNQSDDEMIFMNLYHLVRYEKDPLLVSRYALALHRHWTLERGEMNPLFNYITAAAASGKSYKDAFGVTDLTPDGDWREDSLDTLRRFPIDRFDWRVENSHRLDLVRWTPARGHRLNGKVLPVDERYVDHWNQDPWRFDWGADGRQLSDGAAFLLPYYMGQYFRYLGDSSK